MCTWPGAGLQVQVLVWIYAMLPSLCGPISVFVELWIQEPIICRYLLVHFAIYSWLIVTWRLLSVFIYNADFIILICCFTNAAFFKLFFHTDWHLVVKVTPASVDTDSLLAFIPHFLAHTASSICQCQVTMLINRSVSAAVKICSCVVEARGSP